MEKYHLLRGRCQCVRTRHARRHAERNRGQPHRSVPHARLFFHLPPSGQRQCVAPAAAAQQMMHQGLDILALLPEWRHLDGHHARDHRERADGEGIPAADAGQWAAAMAVPRALVSGSANADHPPSAIHGVSLAGDFPASSTVPPPVRARTICVSRFRYGVPSGWKRSWNHTGGCSRT